MFLTTGLYAIVLSALLIALHGAELPGRRWLHGTVGLNALLFLANLAAFYLLRDSDDYRSTMRAFSVYFAAPVSLAAHVCLLQFALSQFRAGQPAAHRAGLATRPRHWYQPPLWLGATAMTLSAFCLVHQADDSYAKKIVAAVVDPQLSGGGPAASFARQLEFMSTVATAVGGLYIATGLAWLAVVVWLARSYLRGTHDAGETPA